jgi:hypothetical protein
MKVWFTTEKKGYNQLGDYLWLNPDCRDIDSKIYFSELRIVKTLDNDYLLGMWVKDITNLSDKVDKNVFPLAIALWIHRPGSKYNIYSLNDRGVIEIESTKVEQILWHQINDQLDTDSYYSGCISLESNSMLLDKLLTNKSLRQEFSMILVEEIEELQNLKDLRLESGKAGFDGKTTTTKRTASEEAKLNDRLTFILQLASKLQGKEMTLADLYALSVGDESLYGFITNLASLVIK